MRAKLRAESGDAADATTHFAAALRDRRYASEAAARYGSFSAAAQELHVSPAAVSLQIRRIISLVLALKPAQMLWLRRSGLA